MISVSVSTLVGAHVQQHDLVAAAHQVNVLASAQSAPGRALPRPRPASIPVPLGMPRRTDQTTSRNSPSTSPKLAAPVAKWLQILVAQRLGPLGSLRVTTATAVVQRPD